MEDFAQFLAPAMEGYAHIAAQGWNTAPPDPVNPSLGAIPAITEAVPPDPVFTQRLKAAAVAMALSLVLANQNEAPDLDPIREIVNQAAGSDVLPKWSSRPASDDDLLANVIHYVWELRGGSPLSVDAMFIIHLRLFEWLYRSDYMPTLMKQLGHRVGNDWETAICSRAALLKNPKVNVPALSAVLSDPSPTSSFVAQVILAAEPCTGVKLSREYRAMLQGQSSSSRPQSGTDAKEIESGVTNRDQQRLGEQITNSAPDF